MLDLLEADSHQGMQHGMNRAGCRTCSHGVHRVAGCVLAYNAMSSCIYVGGLGSLEVWAQGTLNRMCQGVSSLVNTVRSMRLALDLLSTGKTMQKDGP